MRRFFSPIFSSSKHFSVSCNISCLLFQSTMATAKFNLRTVASYKYLFGSVLEVSYARFQKGRNFAENLEPLQNGSKKFMLSHIYYSKAPVRLLSITSLRYCANDSLGDGPKGLASFVAEKMEFRISVTWCICFTWYISECIVRTTATTKAMGLEIDGIVRWLTKHWWELWPKYTLDKWRSCTRQIVCVCGA